MEPYRAAAIVVPVLDTIPARGIPLGSSTAGVFSFSVFQVRSRGLLCSLRFHPVSELYPKELTDNETVVRKGIFTTVKTISYHKVTNIIESRDLIDGFLVNLGSIKIQTASKSGQSCYEVCLGGLSTVCMGRSFLDRGVQIRPAAQSLISVRLGLGF